MFVESSLKTLFFFQKIVMRPYSQIKQTREKKRREKENEMKYTSHVNNLLKHCAVMYELIHGLCKQENVLLITSTLIKIGLCFALTLLLLAAITNISPLIKHTTKIFTFRVRKRK